MQFLSGFRINTRLIFGFALVLILMAASAAFSFVSTRSMADATASMMAVPLAKERITADWYSIIHSAVVRTTFIASSADTTLAKKFENEINESVKSGTAKSKELEPLLASEQENAGYKKLMDLRKVYQSAKVATMSAKTAGDTDATDKLFNQTFLPAAHAYEQQVMAFLALQRSEINRIAEQIKQTTERVLTAMLALAAAAVALGMAVAYLIARSVTLPIQRALNATDRIASGDLTGNEHIAGRDEMSDLLRSLQTMKQELALMIGQVQQGAVSIATATAEIAAGNLDLSSRTEQQAGTLEETVATMEELTSTVKQNADNTATASELAQQAASFANDGAAVVKTVVDRMHDINDSSSRMAEIITVIDGIAFQTNILALNAAVEAARAGEQGRGFAVVAAEVRSLAQRSAAAAKEIKSLIDTSAAQVQNGTTLVESAGQNMTSIVGSIRKVTDLMGEVSSASNDQRAGIEQINHAMTEMDGVTQQNAALVEQAAAAAESLQGQAAELSAAVRRFTLDTSDNVSTSHQSSRASLAITRPARALTRSR